MDFQATLFFAGTVCLLVTMAVPGSQGLICYSCSGTSGLGSGQIQGCGLPNFNATGTGVTTVTCDGGKCVTQVVYAVSGGVPMSANTGFYRSCTYAPVTDGCEYTSNFGSGQQWSCIKTCTDDRCNMGNDGAKLIPSLLAPLLVLSAAVAARFTL